MLTCKDVNPQRDNCGKVFKQVVGCLEEQVFGQVPSPCPTFVAVFSQAVRARVQAIDVSWFSEGDGIQTDSAICNLEEVQHHLKIFTVFAIDLGILSFLCSCVKVMKLAYEMVNEWDCEAKVDKATDVRFENLCRRRSVFQHFFDCSCPGDKFVVQESDQELMEVDFPSKDCLDFLEEGLRFQLVHCFHCFAGYRSSGHKTVSIPRSGARLHLIRLSISLTSTVRETRSSIYTLVMPCGSTRMLTINSKPSAKGIALSKNSGGGTRCWLLP